MTSSPVGIVDAGPLIAAVDGLDRNHRNVVVLFNDRRWRWVVPALCVAEAAHIIEKKYGPATGANFLLSLGALEVLAPLREEWGRIAELVRQYADFPIGGTDASIVTLAERLDTDTILTLDRRHFGAIRPRHREVLRLLPE
ncbi:MAG: type II toxin-antitoxin system VapC family toxin [Tepidiformaceae bacterium]